tara:strand:- start:1634 stop:1912 length:279 start_codon:yes stop_codon:yes gene_type:complete
MGPIQLLTQLQALVVAEVISSQAGPPGLAAQEEVEEATPGLSEILPDQVLPDKAPLVLSLMQGRVVLAAALVVPTLAETPEEILVLLALSHL